MNYDPSDGMQSDLQEILSAPAAICVADDIYVNKGDIVHTLGFNRILVYPKIVPNASTGGFWIKALIGHDISEVSFDMPDASTDECEVGNKISAEFVLDGLVPFVQLQTKAVVVGGTPATIEMVVTRAWV